MKELKLADLLAAGSASAFLLTVAYVWGYSKALGVELAIYFDLADYSRLAIQWFPVIVIGLAAGRALSAAATRVERGKTEEQIVAASANPGFSRRFRSLADELGWWLFPFAAVASTILYVMGKQPLWSVYSWWAVASMLLWIRLVGWYAKERHLIAHWTQPYLLFVFWFPGLTVASVFFGLQAGLLGRTPLLAKAAQVTVRLRSNADSLQGALLFALDRYLVFRRTDSGSVEIIPQEQVLGIVHRAQPPIAPQLRQPLPSHTPHQ